MKKLLLFSLSVEMLCQRAFAPWAAHLVISPASVKAAPRDNPRFQFNDEAASLARGVTVFAIPKGRVTVAIDAETDEGKTGKGYYLIVSKKRLAGEALELRGALASVNGRAFADDRDAKRNRMAESFEEVRPLQRIEWKGKTVVAAILDREKALRSYVVWDHKVIYEQGGIVADGGLWLTYDIPAFVEASEKPERPNAK